MKDFAKIFNTEYGQVLITNDSRDNKDGEDVPSLNAFFRINDEFGVCEISLKLRKDDQERCDDFFNNMTEKKATGMVEDVVLSMR